MKKSDIKTGVLYAYNHGRRAPSYYSPAVVLSLDTYQSQWRQQDGEPILTRCATRDQKHGRRGGSWSGYDVGYPIVVGGTAEDRERLLALTVDDLAVWVSRSSNPRYEGLRLTAAPGRNLAGPWGEVLAEADREAREKREEQQRQAAANDRARQEAQARIDRLRALGVSVPDASLHTSESWREIRLTLPQVDALLAKVEARS